MLAVLIALATASRAQSLPVRQSMDDAWWTGPMLAPNATTLPHGHILVEPYLYDITTQGSYDSNGVRQSAPHSNGFGSLTYVNYGLANKLTVGMIPVFGYNQVSEGPGSSTLLLGDLTVQAQYRLKLFHEGSRIPTTSVTVQETFPTGKYDRLANPDDGLGSGAYTTTLALYTQDYFWLPNHRILRVRFNVSEAFSRGVDVQDLSVYGTSAGFRGRANPGASLLLDASWEYSLRRSWVLAADATYRHQGNTPVTGYNMNDAMSSIVRLNSGTIEAFALAPAVEYSWKHNIGVLLGVRLIPAGRNTSYTITPAIAINYVH